MTVTAEISTKDRYEILSHCLLSIALQTVKPEAVIVFDDSERPPASADELVKQFPAYAQVFELFNYHKINWQFVYGRKIGQHHNHQHAQQIARTDLLWRIDDDEVAEPDVLEQLLHCMKDDVGAVAGLVLPPAPLPVPAEAANVISDLNRPNLQWFIHPYVKTIEADHLHSTFLYRRGLVNYELSLSPAAHREETLFTHEIKRKGYKLLVDTSVITWHFRAPVGGIRAHQNPQFWEDDEKIFNSKLQEWGINCEPTKTIVLDCGRGDHVIVKSLIPELKQKYGKVVAATCFPDVLGSDVEQISIAEAQQRLGPLDRFSIYRWCIDHNWKGELVDAFAEMYGIKS